MMMVAGHLGYKVGVFSHFVQNLHIYDRHFEAVNELLKNTPSNIQPILKLKENKNFYDYTIDDFEVLNVNNIPKLSKKLEIAI
jgi:thymidylate synthase